jgi:hypothetical protein
MRHAIAILLVCAAVPAAAATCPENIIWYGCFDGVGLPSTNATANYATKMGPWAPGQPCSEGCYDLVSGTLVAKGYGDYYSNGCSSRVLVHDDYQVVGPNGLRSLSRRCSR